MDIAARLQQLEELIAQAKSMPLSASVLVNRDEAFELVHEARDALPEEIKQARWVVKDRENLLAKARRDAEGIIQQALQEQARLVSREEVVQASGKEADRILADAREQARQIRLEAEDYMDQKLAAFEATLTRAQEQIDSIREIQDSMLGRAGEQLVRIREQQEEDYAKVEEQLSRTLQQVQRGRERLRGGSLAEEELGEEGT